MARDHRKLKVFQLADDLVLEVYLKTKNFPREESFGLTSQMRRAAVSVPANIVEGCSRPSNADYLRFLVVAKGSLQELGYYLHLSQRLRYLSDERFSAIDGQYDECACRLQALINAVERGRGAGSG